MSDQNLARYMDAELAGRKRARQEMARKASENARRASYVDYLPESGNFTESDLWDAIADANGLDVSEISDGDLAEWL